MVPRKRKRLPTRVFIYAWYSKITILLLIFKLIFQRLNEQKVDDSHYGKKDLIPHRVFKPEPILRLGPMIKIEIV